MTALLIFLVVLLAFLCAALWADLQSVTDDRDRMRDAVDARDARIVELIRGEDEIDDAHAMGGYDMPPLRGSWCPPKAPPRPIPAVDNRMGA